MLGSINLAEFVKNPFSSGARFDFDTFQKAVRIAVGALNEVLDEGLPLHPLSEQRESVRAWRQIGLGVMGIADMLIKMGLRYGSDKAVGLCSEIADYLLNTAVYASAKLAKEQGAFPRCRVDDILASKFAKANLDLNVLDYVREHGLRNSQLLTIAPTGSLATMLGVSSGIEPVFATSYQRKTESLHGEDVTYTVYTPIVAEYMERFGCTDDSELPDFFVTSADIPFPERIETQAAWQQYIDASISSTVNVPESVTKEQVFDLYVEAWLHGLKGVTIYRQGCKRSGILTTETAKAPEEQQSKAATDEFAWKRGEIIEVSQSAIGKKRKLTTGCGSLHCAAFFDEHSGDLLEIYLSKGSQGGCANYMTGLSRILSLAARGGCDVHAIVDQLMSTGACPSYAVRAATKKDTSKGSCCPMAVGNAILDMWKEMQVELGHDRKTDTDKMSATENEDKNPVPVSQTGAEENGVAGQFPTCPKCDAELRHEGGCVQCMSCGYSKCD